MEQILKILKKEYPEADTALYYSNPLQLLVATILSAQCTDKQVNKVTPELFKKYQSAEDFAKAKLSELEQKIHSTGFYHNKAKNIQACCRTLVEKFKGEVPDTMEALTSLQGVGRKTANVVLPNAFHKNEGVCVDTHVARLSERLGLTQHKDPIKIEQDLMKMTPKKDWKKITDLLICHGRNVCFARKPACERCVLRRRCPYPD